MANPLIFTKDPNPFIQKLTTDLIEVHLITDLNKFSFTLNENHLIVNGIEQPQELFSKLRAKYIMHNGDHYIYSQYYHTDGSGSGSHCEVNVDDKAPVIDSK
jgi:hypothetical protein